MVVYALCALAFFLAVFVGLLPPVVVGDADQNTPFIVRMRPRTDPKFETQPYEAVLAQECVEWLLRWVVVIPLGAIVVLVTPDPLWVAPALAAGHLWVNPTPLKRQFELVGHMAEILVAEHMGQGDEYARAEAKRMRGAYPKLFGKMTVDEIIDAMERRSWIAHLLLKGVARKVGLV